MGCDHILNQYKISKQKEIFFLCGTAGLIRMVALWATIKVTQNSCCKSQAVNSSSKSVTIGVNFLRNGNNICEQAAIIMTGDNCFVAGAAQGKKLKTSRGAAAAPTGGGEGSRNTVCVLICPK